MKRLTQQAKGGFTRRDLVVVILVVVALLAMIIVPAVQKARQKAWRIYCLNNMMCIGTAYRLWAGDHGDLVPWQTSITTGGWSELLTNSKAGKYLWTNYAILRKELGESPAIVVCPADERKPAKTFTNGFDNTHVSYFVGMDTSDVYPQAIAGGDRNLGPGTVPDPNYGYSPTNGQGNNVVLFTNTPVSWSLKMHSHGDPAGSGNILLGDGSGQVMSSASLRQNWLINAQAGTNFPGTNGIRLVFP